MLIIPLDQITIPSSRQRSEMDKAALMELVDTILNDGLLHPPVYRQEGPTLFRLVAGGRRTEAIKIIAKAEKSFICGGETVAPGFIPITPYHSSDRIKLSEAELHENIFRVELPWADRTRALASLHELRSESNPKQTQLATATELATKSGDTTPTNIGRLRNEVQRSIVLAKHLDKPSVANARSEAEAYQIILSEEQANYQAELIRRKVKTTAPAIKCEIRHGDASLIMPTMDDNQFDLILTDPPYGLNAGQAGYRSRTVLHHNYDDTPENARMILQSILTEGWRITKSKANLFIFTDIKHFEFLQQAAANMAWTPWRHPIIWQKSTAEGLVPWGRNGFVHTFDIIFFATKGQRGTNATNVDILNYPRVKRNERIYAAEKPIPLLSRLIELTTLPGDSVFDPCAGSGSTLLAAKRLGRHSSGIEIDLQATDLATVRINQGDDAGDFSVLDQLSSESSEADTSIPTL